MARTAHAVIKGNRADLNFGPEWADQHLKVTVNSKFKQLVRIRADDEVIESSGIGERTAIVDRMFRQSRKKLSITLEYLGDDGQVRAPKLQMGGPFQVARYRTVFIVAESGHGSDENDVVVQISGRSTTE